MVKVAKTPTAVAWFPFARTMGFVLLATTTVASRGHECLMPSEGQAGDTELLRLHTARVVALAGPSQ